MNNKLLVGNKNDKKVKRRFSTPRILCSEKKKSVQPSLEPLGSRTRAQLVAGCSRGFLLNQSESRLRGARLITWNRCICGNLKFVFVCHPWSMCTTRSTLIREGLSEPAALTATSFIMEMQGSLHQPVCVQVSPNAES